MSSVCIRKAAILGFEVGAGAKSQIFQVKNQTGLRSSRPVQLLTINGTHHSFTTTFFRRRFELIGMFLKCLLSGTNCYYNPRVYLCVFYPNKTNLVSYCNGVCLSGEKGKLKFECFGSP